MRDMAGYAAQVAVEHRGKRWRYNGANGMSDMEGKMTSDEIRPEIFFQWSMRRCRSAFYEQLRGRLHSFNAEHRKKTTRLSGPARLGS